MIKYTTEYEKFMTITIQKPASSFNRNCSPVFVAYLHIMSYIGRNIVNCQEKEKNNNGSYNINLKMSDK